MSTQPVGESIKNWATGKGIRWLGGIASLITLVSFVTGSWLKVPAWAYAIGYLSFALGLGALMVHTILKLRRTESNLNDERSKLQSVQSKLESESQHRNNTFNAMQRLHDIVHDLRDHIAKLDSPQSEEVRAERRREKLQRCLGKCTDKVSEAMGLLVNHDCACCVKCFFDEEDEHGYNKIITFCRDDRSGRERGEMDEEEEFKVLQNYDFEQIMEHGQSFFFSNNLPKDEDERKYYNSREDYREYYKAAAVFPIQRSYFQNMESGQEQTINDLMGFLCVDCSETDVFDKDETFAVMSTVADAMYWPLRRLKNIQQEE